MNPFAKKPFDRSFAVIPGLVWGGNYPGDRDPIVMREKLLGLTRCGVYSIFNLMEEGEIDHDGLPFVPYEAMWKGILDELWGTLGHGRTEHYDWMPIPDNGVVTERVMHSYLSYIHYRAVRSPIFVHCWGGRGRTGTVLGCFLVDVGIVNGTEALRVLDRVRVLSGDPKANQAAPQTTQQRDMVRNWQPTNLERFDYYSRQAEDLGIDWLGSVELLRGLARGK